MEEKYNCQCTTYRHGEYKENEEVRVLIGGAAGASHDAEAGRAAGEAEEAAAELTELASGKPLPPLVGRRLEYPASQLKYGYLTWDLLAVAFRSKQAGLAAALLVGGIAMCLAANRIKIVSIKVSSDMIEQLVARDIESVKTIGERFLYSTLHSIVRELYVLAFVAFVNIVVFELSHSVFAQVLRSNSQLSSVRINRVLERGRQGISLVLQKVLLIVFSKTMGILMALYEIWEISPLYLSFVFVFNVLYVLVSWWLIKRRIRCKKEINRYDDLLNTKIMEIVENQEVIECMNTEVAETAGFKTHLWNLLSARFKDSQNVFFLHILQKFIYSLLTVSILFHIYLTSQASIVQKVVRTVELVRMLDQGVMGIALAVKDVFVSYVDCEECLALQKELAAAEPRAAVGEYPLSQTASEAPLVLEFAEVSFGYPGSGREVLRNLSFVVREGEKVCLVGRSGAGKSTALALLRKRYQHAGAIYLHRTNIATLSKDAITKQVAIVPQDSGMFNNTLEYNIRYGSSEASEEEFALVARALFIDRIAESKPEGYQHVVEEGGRNLSGGEKQRIAIARALLRRPSVLVLDESTSKIDWEMQEAIFENLKELPITLVVITHSIEVSELLGGNNIVIGP